MKRLFGSSQTKGFTLIELLVVIAIIGILSTLLFPAIQGALLKTKAASVGAKMGGKGLTGIVYGKSVENSENYLDEVFPSSKGDHDFAGLSSSTDYFKELFKLNAVTSVMTSATISIPGQRKMPPKEADSLTSDQNLWCVVQDVNTSSNPGMPFMFTKNIQWASLDAEPTIRFNADNNEPILNDKYAIVIYAQGAVRIFELDPDVIKRDVIFQGGVGNNAVLDP